MVRRVGIKAKRRAEYVLIGCVGIVLLGFIYHQVGVLHARQERVERIGAQCRKVVNAAAARLASEHPELKWSAGFTRVLGDLTPDTPDANMCVVEMTFQRGSDVEKETWTVSDLLGNFQLSSARFRNTETVQ